MSPAVRGSKSFADIVRRQVPTIEFIGVWDTVVAYGLPIDEMTRGISNWVWPLELPNRILSHRVKYARYALALDDERTTFHPVLWTEQKPDDPAPAIPATIDGEKLVQVWFVGMHANVGGGYPDDAVAFVPLSWLLREAAAHARRPAATRRHFDNHHSRIQGCTQCLRSGWKAFRARSVPIGSWDLGADPRPLQMRSADIRRII